MKTLKSILETKMDELGLNEKVKNFYRTLMDKENTNLENPLVALDDKIEYINCLLKIEREATK